MIVDLIPYLFSRVKGLREQRIPGREEWLRQACGKGSSKAVCAAQGLGLVLVEIFVAHRCCSSLVGPFHLRQATPIHRSLSTDGVEIGEVQLNFTFERGDNQGESPDSNRSTDQSINHES